MDTTHYIQRAYALTVFTLRIKQLAVFALITTGVRLLVGVEFAVKIASPALSVEDLWNLDYASHAS